LAVSPACLQQALAGGRTYFALMRCGGCKSARGPEADRRAKPLIQQATKGAMFAAYEGDDCEILRGVGTQAPAFARTETDFTIVANASAWMKIVHSTALALTINGSRIAN